MIENVSVFCKYEDEKDQNAVNNQGKFTCDLYNDKRNNKTALDKQGKKLYSVYIDTGNGTFLTKWSVDYGVERYLKISFTFVVLFSILLLWE